jgi:hypothetical protein
LLLHPQVDDCRTHSGRHTDDSLPLFQEPKGDLNMFFKQGLYNPATIAEGRTWLVQFQGAMSISLNQYFRRDEEETHSQGSDCSLLGDGSLLGLETFQQPLLCQFEDLPSGDETIPDNDQVR